MPNVLSRRLLKWRATARVKKDEYNPMSIPRTSFTVMPSDPNSLTLAKWVHPGELIVAYQDGKVGSVNLSNVLKDEVLSGLLMETVRVSGNGAAVELTKRTGGTYHLDALALRAIIDPRTKRMIRNETKRVQVRLGSHLRSVREKQGLPLADLSRAANIPEPDLTSIEEGKVMPRGKTLAALASAMGLSLNAILPSHK